MYEPACLEELSPTSLLKPPISFQYDVSSLNLLRLQNAVIKLMVMRAISWNTL